MFNLIASNPFVMALAVIGFMNATVTIQDGYTGAITRADHIERLVEPGTSYRIPWFERVVTLPTVAHHGVILSQTTQLSNGSTCDLRLSYHYTVTDIEHAVEALQYGRVRRLKPRLIEAHLRDAIDEIFGQTAIADLDRNFEDEFERRLFDRVNAEYPDGTTATHVYIQSLECADPDAARALETSRRPVSASGSAEAFTSLTACGEATSSDKQHQMQNIDVFTADKIRTNLSGLNLSYRIVDPEAEEAPPEIIAAFVRTALSNELIEHASTDIGTVNLCPVLLDDAILNASLARFGVKLVALDPDTPQYAIHEPIE